MDLSDLQEAVKDWTSHNFPNAEPWQPLVGAMEELGELSHAHLKAYQGIRTNTNFRLDEADAVGDIIVYLADYCNRNYLDLSSCVQSAWRVASARNWIKYPVNRVSE